MSTPLLYRVQDRWGRGPFRPGFSNSWLDADRGEEHLQKHPPIFLVLGMECFSRIPKYHHAGVGCKSLDDLRSWFSENELTRLRFHGYSIVAITPDVIIGDAGNQVLFATRRPLAKAGLTIA